jgi:hypothetical protein
MNAKLYVVTSIFNPRRFKSRYALYGPFAKHVLDSGGELVTAEVAFGERPHAVPDDHAHTHVRLRTSSELWLKENALNLAAQRLPADWEYVAFVDADVTFARPDWVTETLHLLQHTPVLQMFSHATDVTNDFEPLHTHQGFVSSYWHGADMTKKPYEGAHPGFAWAFRRDAFDHLGGLIDFAILGAGDRHMACSLLTGVERSYPEGLSPGYVAELKKWEARARGLKQNVGYMPGTVVHHWHGPKRSRGYRSRWQVLVDHDYDPNVDVVKDWQGLYRLTDAKPGLRDDIRRYFLSRNEDHLHVPG